MVVAERQRPGTVEGTERPDRKRKLNHTLRMTLPDIERTDPASPEDRALSSTRKTEGVARYRWRRRPVSPSSTAPCGRCFFDSALGSP
jgi:hypothetical protein